jgi:protocatechuate 3,4-dioxygenase beta subunit
VRPDNQEGSAMRAARMVVVGCVVAAVLAWAAPASAAPPATFTGRVVDENGDGIAATITAATTADPPTIPLAPQATAADGTFSVQVPDGGEWTLRAYAPGRILQTVYTTANDGQTVDVGWIELDPGATVKGTVVDSDGSPLGAVRVEGLFSNISTVTAADGTYEMGVPEGDEVLSYSKPGYLQRCYPPPSIGMLSACSEGSVTLATGTTTTIDVTLLRPALLQGSVSAVGDSPGGLTVQLLDAVTLDPREAITSYANPVDFTFSVPPGSYILRAVAIDGVHATVYYDDAYEPADAAVLTVDEDDVVTGIDVALPVGGSISGRVTDSNGNPIAGAPVGVWQIDSSGIVDQDSRQVRFADADGHYKIGGLSATDYVVASAASLNGTLTYHPSASSVADAARVAVTLGEETTGIDIQLVVPAHGTVTMRRADGSIPTGGITGIGLCPPGGLLNLASFACSNGPLSASGASDANGVTPFAAVNPGSYNVVGAVSGVVSATTLPLTLVAGDTFACTFIVDGPGSSCTITHASGPPDDQDGVPSAVKDGAPNGGDGNGDGTIDSEQANVTSLPAALGTGYVTIAAPDGVEVSSVTVDPPPATPALPPGSSIDAGVIAYTLHGVAPGSTVDVEIHLSGGVTANSYLKLQGETWAELPPSAFDIAGDVVTLHLQDGGVGDEDGAPNGTIVDPGAPAALDKTAPVVTCPSTPNVLFKQAGATLTASASDTGSGVASAAVTVPVATGTAGLRTVEVTATDLAGNTGSASCSYRVVYAVQWVVPLGGPGPRSAERDGVVPLTFRLADATGAAVPGSVVSAPTSTPVSCPSGAMPSIVTLDKKASATTTALGGGLWLAGWKADKAWKGTCRLVRVPLGDGTAPTMVIKVV